VVPLVSVTELAESALFGIASPSACGEPHELSKESLGKALHREIDHRQDNEKV
jgi:hypothetical protein